MNITIFQIDSNAWLDLDIYTTQISSQLNPKQPSFETLVDKYKPYSIIRL